MTDQYTGRRPFAAIAFTAALVLASLSPPCPSADAGTATTVAGPTWDALLPLSTTPHGYFVGPVFDSAGDAWALVYDTTLRVLRSSGATGSWAAPVTLLDPLGDAFNPQIAVDAAGNVSVVYWSGGYSQLTAFHYSSATGWQGPEVAYSSAGPVFFGAINLATDSANNLVVVFDQMSAESRSEAWTIVYSRATGTWGAAQQLSAPGRDAFLQTVAQSKDGSTIMLAYLQDFPGEGRVYSHVWAASSRSWRPAQRLPAATKLVDYGIAFLWSRFPLTVDASGDATLLAPLSGAIYGFRYEGGRWKRGTQLLETFIQFMLDYGDAAVNDSGVVLGAMTNFSPEGTQTLWIFRFTPGEGWNTEMAAEISTPNNFSRCRVAWFGASGEAVATYQDSELRSVVYTDGAWSRFPTIPGALSTASHETATAPTGEVLLLLDATDADPPTGIVATWLRR